MHSAMIGSNRQAIIPQVGRKTAACIPYIIAPLTYTLNRKSNVALLSLVQVFAIYMLPLAQLVPKKMPQG